MAQYPKRKSIGSIGSIVLAILEIQVLVGCKKFGTWMQDDFLLALASGQRDGHVPTFSLLLCICTCMYVYIYIHVFVDVHTYAYDYIYISGFACTYIYIYIDNSSSNNNNNNNIIVYVYKVQRMAGAHHEVAKELLETLTSTPPCWSFQKHGAAKSTPIYHDPNDRGSQNGAPNCWRQPC